MLYTLNNKDIIQFLVFIRYIFLLGTPDGNSMKGCGSISMTIFLNRHTGFDRSCRVRFNMRVAEGGLIKKGLRLQLQKTTIFYSYCTY